MSFIRVTDRVMGEELLTGAAMTTRTIPFARPLYIPETWQDNHHSTIFSDENI